MSWGNHYDSSYLDLSSSSATCQPSIRRFDRLPIERGWRMVYCHRGDYFDTIEFWVENQLSWEFLSNDEVEEAIDRILDWSIQLAPV
jgi:hypothetical protein